MEIIEAPAYVRPVPAVRFGVAGLIAVVVFALMLGAWELHWRGEGARPATVNSDVLWALQRERIDKGEGDATVFIGSSRVLFDMNLDVWEKLDGRRPIQLALEGTSPLLSLEGLAKDTAFKGKLMIGVTPPLFFSGFGYRAKAITGAKDITLPQRSGQWLSMHLLEPVFAFLDPDYALFALLKRQDWPPRAGVRVNKDVRKLAESGPDRNTHLWDRVVRDTAYRGLARRIWAQNFAPPPGMTPEKGAAIAKEQIDRASAAVATLRARGVTVMFVRLPSSGAYLESERKGFPRERTWDVLLAQSGAPGVHFEDHAELQGFDTPEWSHLTAEEAVRFTEALHGVMARTVPSMVRRSAAQ